MAKQNIKTKSGFTIIEVVLVLAIAGLIFLMVFVALPALQRSQRDTARRDAMSRIDTSLSQYQTNNNTKTDNLPGQGSWIGDDTFDNSCSSNTACAFIRDYMNSGAAGENTKNSFNDPDGVPYSLVITKNWGIDAGATEVKNTEAPVFTQLNTNPESALEYSAIDDGFTINTGSFSSHVVYIVPGAKCNGSSAQKSEKRHFAILYRLEGAGVYCIDDQ